MANATYNTTLEYANNELEFWLYDENGESQTGFASDTNLYITRADGTTSSYSAAAEDITISSTGDGVNNHILIKINPPTSLAGSDDIYDYDNDTFDHVYSLRSSEKVYLLGKLNLIGVA